MKKIKPTRLAKFHFDDFYHNAEYLPPINEVYRNLFSNDCECMKKEHLDVWYPAHFCDMQGNIDADPVDVFCLRIFYEGKWRHVLTVDFETRCYVSGVKEGFKL